MKILLFTVYYEEGSYSHVISDVYNYKLVENSQSHCVSDSTVKTIGYSIFASGIMSYHLCIFFQPTWFRPTNHVGGIASPHWMSCVTSSASRQGNVKVWKLRGGCLLAWFMKKVISTSWTGCVSWNMCFFRTYWGLKLSTLRGNEQCLLAWFMKKLISTTVNPFNLASIKVCEFEVSDLASF